MWLIISINPYFIFFRDIVSILVSCPTCRATVIYSGLRYVIFCFDTNLIFFVMEIAPEKNNSWHKDNLIYVMKHEGLYLKQSHRQPRVHA